MGRHWKTIAPMFKRCPVWRIVEGDMVQIVTGKDKGQVGKVLSVRKDDRKPRVVVEGRNMVKKRIPKTPEGPGRIITKEAALAYSNVRLLDPVTHKPVRAAFKFLEDGTRVRVSRGRFASNTVIPFPETPAKPTVPPDYKSRNFSSVLHSPQLRRRERKRDTCRRCAAPDVLSTCPVTTRAIETDCILVALNEGSFVRVFVLDARLHWEGFWRLSSQSTFDGILSRFERPETPFFKGLSLFQKADAESTAAFKRRNVTFNGRALTIKAPYVDDACAISQDLGLHVYQAYRLREIVGDVAESTNRARIRAEAKEIYFAERLALLRGIRDVLRERVRQLDKDNTRLDALMSNLRNRSFVPRLLGHLIEQLKVSRHCSAATAPLSAGEGELHALVDVLLLAFRDHWCSATDVKDLCMAIKQLSASEMPQKIYLKVTLMPMLASGLWKLLEIKPTEQHPLHDNFSDLDKFFVEWNYENSNDENAIVHISWHLFRNLYKSRWSPVEDPASMTFVSDVGIQCVPPILRQMLGMMHGVSEESLVRESLLIIMGACMRELSIYTNKAHCTEAFQVISDICYGDAFVCRALVLSRTHAQLRKLVTDVIGCIGLDPEPGLLIMSGFCFPEVAESLAEFVTHRVKHFAVLHSTGDGRNRDDRLDINCDSAVRVSARTNIFPSLGFQIDIPQGSVGRIPDSHFPTWLVPDVPQSQVIWWEVYSFGIVFVSMFQRRVLQLRSGEEPHSAEILSNVQHLVRFAADFFDAAGPSGGDFLPFQRLNRIPHKASSLVEDTMFLVEVLHRERQSVAEALRLLRHFCKHHPTEVLRSLSAAFLFDGVNPQEILTLVDVFHAPKDFAQARAVVDLLTEFVNQRQLFDELELWMRVICDKLLKRLKQPADAPPKQKAELLLSVIDFMQSVVSIEAGSSLAAAFCDQLENGFVVEDCTKAVVKLMPEELVGSHRHQTQIVTASCKFLAHLLGMDLSLTTQKRIVATLLKLNDWDNRSVASRLALFVAKVQESEGSQSLDVECSVAALKFFTALMDHFGKFQDADSSLLGRVLPREGSGVHPVFRRSLMMTSYFHGRPLDYRVTTETFNLMVATCAHSSEFLAFLVFPSTLVPGSESTVPTLFDVAWRTTASHVVTFREQPHMLLASLRAMAAVQRSSDSRGKQAWELAQGQDGFHRILTSIALKSRRDIGEQIRAEEEITEVHEQCRALALDILCKETLSQNSAAAAALSSVFQNRWTEWTLMLETAAGRVVDDGTLVGITILANAVAYEVLTALAPDGPAAGMQVPWTEQLRQIVGEILEGRDLTPYAVTQYVRSVLRTGLISNEEITTRIMLLRNPSVPFEFLTSEKEPVPVVLKHLMPPQRRPTLIQDQAAWPFKSVELPESLGSHCTAYPILKSFLNLYLKMRLQLGFLRSRIVASWSALTVCMFTAAPSNSTSAAEKMKRALYSLGTLCRTWIHRCHCLLMATASNLALPDDRAVTPLIEEELFWTVQLCAALSQAVVMIADLIPKFKRAAPSGLHGPEAMPEGVLSEACCFWFQSISVWKEYSGFSRCKAGFLQTTKNLTLLCGYILPRLCTGANPDPEVQFHILSGILKATVPKNAGFEVASPALQTLAKLIRSNALTEDMLEMIGRDFCPAVLLDQAAYCVRRLVVDSGKPTENAEVSVWSKNLLLLCRTFLHHTELRSCVGSADVFSNLWNYCAALFAPHGGDLYCKDEETYLADVPANVEAVKGECTVMEYMHSVHFRKAYKKDNRVNPAYEQWCLLLDMIGDVTDILGKELGHPAGQLFERTATLLFQTFSHYIGSEYGTYREPLTLQRVKRMEASLQFVLSSHTAFSASVALLAQYSDRREDVLNFLVDAAKMLRRCDSTFVCPPISDEEKAMATQHMSFDTEHGFFGICKLGAHRAFFPGRGRGFFGEALGPGSDIVVSYARDTLPAFSLTRYSWKLSKGLYRCVDLSLQYVQKAMPTAKRKQMGREKRNFKQVMEGLQEDVGRLGTWLTNLMAIEENPSMRAEMLELARSLARIAFTTVDFLCEWGVVRNRRQHDQFSGQVDSLHQLVEEAARLE